MSENPREDFKSYFKITRLIVLKSESITGQLKRLVFFCPMGYLSITPIYLLSANERCWTVDHFVSRFLFIFLQLSDIYSVQKYQRTINTLTKERKSAINELIYDDDWS